MTIPDHVTGPELRRIVWEAWEWAWNTYQADHDGFPAFYTYGGDREQRLVESYAQGYIESQLLSLAEEFDRREERERYEREIEIARRPPAAEKASERRCGGRRPRRSDEPQLGIEP
jgi:hypothetical protein